MKKNSPLLLASLLIILTLSGSALAQNRAHTTTARQPAHDAATLTRMIEQAALEAGISPHLLSAVVRQESSGKWWVVSPKGAAGLAQLMPGTAARFGVRNRFNPMENLRGGARYLRYLLDYFNGDVKLALAGYNAGEGAVNKYGRRIPPYRETQDYVAKIYPRFVTMATQGGGGAGRVVPTSSRQPAGITLAPVQVNSKAKALILANAGQQSGQESETVAASEETLKVKESTSPTRTTMSVYFWPAPARLSTNVLPK